MNIKEKLIELKEKISSFIKDEEKTVDEQAKLKLAEEKKNADEQAKLKLAEEKKKADKLAEEVAAEQATVPTVESLQAEVTSLSEEIATLGTRMDDIEAKVNPAEVKAKEEELKAQKILEEELTKLTAQVKKLLTKAVTDPVINKDITETSSFASKMQARIEEQRKQLENN